MAVPFHVWCRIFVLGLVATGCGAAAVRPAPIPATTAAHCSAVAAAYAAKVTTGQHVEVQVQWSETAGDETIREAELARRLAQGVAGSQVWVLGRGGSGKSHLADLVEASLCRESLALRVDCERDLAPRMVGAPDRGSALAQVLAEQLGLAPQTDPTEALRSALSGPWTLILDGTDELSAHEQVLLLRDLRWLSLGPWVQPSLIRFERPGFDGNEGGPRPRAIVSLATLRCDQADGVLARRFADAAALAAARAWLAAHHLDRQRSGGTGCSYVHMPTWRDAELVADLAADAARGARPLPAHVSQADLWQAWIGNRWAPGAANADASLAWIDRMTAASARGAATPDLVLTQQTCTASAPEGLATAAEACAALFASPVTAPARATGTWMPRHRTLVDVALARWLVAKHGDCRSLANAVAGHASLELMAMVVAQPAGRRCLDRVLGAACEQGMAAKTLQPFVDEVLPREPAVAAQVRLSRERATSACVRQVLEGLDSVAAPSSNPAP